MREAKFDEHVQNWHWHEFSEANSVLKEMTINVHEINEKKKNLENRWSEYFQTEKGIPLMPLVLQEGKYQGMNFSLWA